MDREERFAMAISKLGTMCGMSTFFVLFAISMGAIFSIPFLLLYGPGTAAALGGISSFATYYGYFRILCRRKKLNIKEEGKGEIKGEVKGEIKEFIKSLPEIVKSIGCLPQLFLAAFGVSLVASAVTYAPLLKGTIKSRTEKAQPPPVEKTVKAREIIYYLQEELAEEEEEEEWEPEYEMRFEDGKYVIQVTLVNTMEQADRVAQRLERNGIKAYIAKVKDPGGIVGTKYRVRVGGFESIYEARTYAQANIAPLGYDWYIDKKSNDHIGNPTGYKPPEQQFSSLPVMGSFEPPVQQAASAPALLRPPIVLPEDPYAVNSSRRPIRPAVESPAPRSGGGIAVPSWVGVSLAAAGIGAGIYGFWQDSKYDNFYKDFKSAKSMDEEKANEQKAEEAKSQRNKGYKIGSALLASGITIYFVF